MTGNIDQAEDMVQDTYLRWMDVQMDSVRHIKAFLVKIITNRCINFLHSAQRQREEYIGIWLPEPLQDRWHDPVNTRTETWHALSIGVLLLLEKLSPQERAIFLLKEIFAYDYYELSEIFDKTPDNCRQILKRAKDHLGQDTRRFEVDMKVHEKILHNFLQAIDGGENIGRLLLAIIPKFRQALPDFNQQVIIANGMPSIVSFSGDIPQNLVSLDIDDDRIRNIYVQTNPAKLRHLKKDNI